jgi:hypothetical protein
MVEGGLLKESRESQGVRYDGGGSCEHKVVYLNDGARQQLGLRGGATAGECL